MDFELSTRIGQSEFFLIKSYRLRTFFALVYNRGDPLRYKDK